MPDDLAPLNRDDPRPAYKQLANILRAAILNRTFGPGDRLPSQPELASRYGIAKETARRALEVLVQDGLITSHQGVGSYVRERTAKPVGLRPHIEGAFDHAHVTLDFVGYTGETLYNAVQEPIDKIRTGQLSAKSLVVRALIADMTTPTSLPSRADVYPSDDPLARARTAATANRFAGGLIDAISELSHLGLVDKAVCEVKSYPTAAAFKLYIINGTEAFFGFYPIMRHDVPLDGKEVPIFDPMGKDAELFHFADEGDPNSLGYMYVREASRWFESTWTTIARQWQPSQ